MRTYLFKNTFNRLKNFSANQEAISIICDKAWNVFNDDGEAELFIFNTDGSIIITNNGTVTNGKWKFISANKSLIIKTERQEIMLVPSFIDGIIFALNQHGTDEYVFLIDSNNIEKFQPKTLTDLNKYFEKKLLEVQKKELEYIKEQEKKAKEKQELEAKTELNKKDREEAVKLFINIRYEDRKIKTVFHIILISLFLISLFLLGLVHLIFKNIEDDIISIFIILILLFTLSITYCGHQVIIEYTYKQDLKNINTYIEEHADKAHLKSHLVALANQRY